MVAGYSVDRFVAGFLMGAVIAWSASAGMDHWGVSGHIRDAVVLRLAIEAFLAACLVLPRPLLLKTIFRSRRSVFIRDEDVRAMLHGRIVGILGGVWVGATVNGVFF